MKEYQQEYSTIKEKALYNRKYRESKAKKMVAVLSDFYGKEKLKELSCLDVGCSTGWIPNYLSDYFGETVGIDIDKLAVDFATGYGNKAKIEVGDGIDMKFEDNSFDVITCQQIYEHVPDSKLLAKEIYRVLKPGGICFFSGTNRLWYWEDHNNLFGLSWLPVKLANKYSRFFTGKDYYETLLTYWQLRKLFTDFTIHDYTKKIINDPLKYDSTDVIKPKTVTHILAKILPVWLSKGFIWLLQK